MESKWDDFVAMWDDCEAPETILAFMEENSMFQVPQRLMVDKPKYKDPYMKLLAKPRTQKWLREFVHSQEFAKSCWYYVKRYKLVEYVASSCSASIERVLIQYVAADEYSPEIILNVIVYSNVNNDVVNDAAVIQFLRAVTQRFITDARDQVLLHILQGKQSAIPSIVSVGIITPIVEHYYYARHDPTRAIDEFLLKLLALARQSYDRSTRRDTEWFICGMKFLKYSLTEAEHRDGVFELLRTSIGEDYKRSCELLLWTTLKELADEGGLVLSLSLSLSLYWATYAPLYLIVERICVPEKAFSTLSRALLINNRARNTDHWCLGVNRSSCS